MNDKKLLNERVLGLAGIVPITSLGLYTNATTQLNESKTFPKDMVNSFKIINVSDEIKPPYVAECEIEFECEGKTCRGFYKFPITKTQELNQSL